MAADGKITIDVILDDGKVVKGVANIGGKIDGIGGAAKTATVGIGKMVAALGLVAAAQKGIEMVAGALDGAISRFDTLQGFPVVMERMGFSTDQAKQSIDKLSDGIQGLPTTLDGIVASTQRIALMTGDLDGATDTALALNNAFLASGSSAADAERGLTQYVQMLGKGKVDMQSWYTLQETMGFALNKTAEAFGYTGKSAQNDLYDALQSGTVTFDQFNEKMIELSGGVGGFAEIAKSSTAGIKTAWTNMNTAIVRGVTEIIEAINDVLANTPLESIENVISMIGKTFYNVLTMIAGLIESAAGPISSFFSLFEEGAIKMGSAFKEDGISGLITAFVEMLPQLMEVGMQMVQNLVQGFTSNVQMFADTAITAVQSWISNIGTIYPMILETGTQMIITLASGIGGNLPQLVSTIFDVITAIVETILNLLPTLLESGIQILQSVIEGIINTLPELISGILELVATIIDTIISMLPEIVLMGVELVLSLIMGILDMLPDIINAILNLVDSLIKTILDNLPRFIEAAIQIIMALIDGIVEAIPKIVNAILTLLTKLIEVILSNLPLFISAAIEIIIALNKGLLQAAPQILKAIMQIIGEMVLEILNFDWISVGKDIVNGLISGIKQMSTKAVEAISGVVGGIVDKAKSLLQIKSPSRVFMQFGNFIDEGLANGIKNGAKDVVKSMSEVIDSVVAVGDNLNKDTIGSKGIGFSEIKEDAKSNIAEMYETSERQLDELEKLWLDSSSSIVDTTDKELSRLKQVGINAGQGLLNGLASMEPALLAKARQIANAIKATIQSALDIHSPSRWMRDFVAGNMAKGFVIGVDKYKGLITNASDKLTDYIKPTITNRLRGVKPSFGAALTATGSTTTNNSSQYSYDNSRKMENTIYIQDRDNNKVRALERQLKRLEYGY